MTFSLYDSLITPGVLRLDATSVLIDKAIQYCEQGNASEQSLIEARLTEDMRPFPFQIKALVTHSRGAIESVKAGVYRSGSDTTPEPQTFADARRLLDETAASLSAMSRDEVDALADKPVRFDGVRSFADFVGSAFLMQFSLPNFYFHGTTAYNLLRAKGVPIGKMDFLGALPFQPKG